MADEGSRLFQQHIDPGFAAEIQGIVQLLRQLVNVGFGCGPDWPLKRRLIQEFAQSTHRGEKMDTPFVLRVLDRQ